MYKTKRLLLNPNTCTYKCKTKRILPNPNTCTYKSKTNRILPKSLRVFTYEAFPYTF